MGKLIVLKIITGNFDSGFSVGLQVWDERGGFPSVDRSGYLPPHPHLEGDYFNWQTIFRRLNSPNRSDDFGIDENLPDSYSSDDDREACGHFAKLLENNMKTWLLQTVDAGWQEIREQVIKELSDNQGNIRIVIQAEPQLWKMPWLEWDILSKDENYRDIGIGFSPVAYQKLKKNQPLQKQGDRVRILAVFGNNENIDLTPDKQAILQLPDVELEALEQPSAAQMIQKLRDKRGWDIFFFAGHSQTKGDEGIIYINERESLEIGQFKEALKEAIRQGLQLAIFNSCDGLGLAEKLASLQLPIAIVMKEPVPDRVAQCFLKEFLKEYAAGAYLYTAVRRSQKCLEEFADFPGCTGLPIVCQNPAEVPPTWEELRGRERPDSLEIIPEKRAEINPRVRDREQYRLFSWRRLKLPLTASLIIATLVMGMRWQGKLERWELPAYDHLMQQRPIHEEPDRRILVIRVTEEDRDRLNQPVEETGQGARSLSDQTLESILAKLNTMQPLIIGLNILREGPVDSNYPTLKSSLEEGRLIATCVPKRKFSSNPEIHRPISAPDGVPQEKIGFDDFVFDLFNPVIRRQLLLMTTKNSSYCRSNEIESLSLRIATFYLERQNKIRIDGKQDNFIRFDNVYFPQLKIHRGGYHSDQDVEGGIQVMLNYKPYQDYRKDFVRSVTLTDFLNNDLPTEQVKDSIVLIGRDSSDERHLTPYSKWNTPDEKIPGVFLHAQMISHIIDVVEGNRPLIWTWAWWVDGLWIWMWSLVGGVVTVNSLQFSHRHSVAHSLFNLALFGTIALGILYGLCLGFLLIGGWLPLVPSALALLITGVSVIFDTFLQQQRNY